MAESATLTEMTVQVPKQALARIEALAAQTGQSTSELVGEALVAFLDYQEWKIAAIAEAVKEADAGGPFIEHERVEAWVRSWGIDHELPRPT